MEIVPGNERKTVVHRMLGDSIEPLTASLACGLQRAACREQLHTVCPSLLSTCSVLLFPFQCFLMVTVDVQGFLDTIEEVVHLFDCHASVLSVSFYVFIWKIVKDMNILISTSVTNVLVSCICLV